VPVLKFSNIYKQPIISVNASSIVGAITASQIATSCITGVTVTAQTGYVSPFMSPAEAQRRFEATNHDHLQVGDVWRVGDVYGGNDLGFLYAVGNPGTSIQPGSHVSQEMLCYRPRRLRLPPLAAALAAGNVTTDLLQDISAEMVAALLFEQLAPNPSYATGVPTSQKTLVKLPLRVTRETLTQDKTAVINWCRQYLVLDLKAACRQSGFVDVDAVLLSPHMTNDSPIPQFYEVVVKGTRIVSDVVGGKLPDQPRTVGINPMTPPTLIHHEQEQEPEIKKPRRRFNFSE
jgi:hypothetical protein